MDTQMDYESDSENSNSDEDSENMLLSKAEELERNLSDNKYLYDAHVELVSIYRQIGDLKSMRLAYQRFHEFFPLTPALWLAWIEDEKKIASSDNDKKHIISLFEKAVDDYMSVKLWQEYAQYSIGVNSIEETRQILEKGLTAAGLHAGEGSLLWDTLRVLESAHLALLKEGTAEWNEQIGRIIEVFRRQLSVPLMEMESTYSEWQKFVESVPKEHQIDPKPVEWGYNKALKTLELYKPFENKLLAIQDETELYDVYQEYIKIVTDPSTIICLYERAAVQLCLMPNVWLDYVTYTIKLGEAAIKASDRALRNCPWSQELWILRLRLLEQLEKNSTEILKCFEEAIASLGVQCANLWIAYLEYVNRNSDEKDKLYKLFDQAVEQLHPLNETIIRWYARLAAKAGNMAKARSLWKKILSLTHNKGSAALWLEFSTFERFYGEERLLRNLYKRAITNCTDNPQKIADEWLMFERESGSLQDILKCEEACKEFVKNTPQQQLQDVQQGEQRKRKSVLQQEDESKRMRAEPVRKAKVLKDPKVTVFISNLYPSITEKKLKKVFPNAVNIELVIDRQGKSRCYGYVQFALEEEAMTALARDRELLEGRPIFISTCKPDKVERTKLFKYSTQVEKNKLFIKNLPLSTTKIDLEQIYKPLGAVDVRIVSQKSGQSKGLAFVEFENEEQANKALTKTNEMKIGDHVISVAISAPPQKGSGKNAEPAKQTKTFLKHSRLQVPLIPRVVQSGSSKRASENTNGQQFKMEKKTNDDFRKMLLNN